MSRVFYYSGYRMTIFHWAGEKLIDSYSFLPDESGLNDFKQYLISSANEPVRLLVDVIEEDYFKDHIPHVSRKDREAIIRRRVIRNYPKSGDWFYSRVVGRDTEGRRDDQVIYSVQTNPDMLKPWLDIMEQSRTPLSGIWSLSLLSEKLIKIMGIEDEYSLLMTQQVPSNLRQSFFKNGQLHTSRSGVVNLDEMSLAEHIVKELNQTSSYLANQRHIGFDEVLMVHIICPARQIDLLQTQLEDTALRQYHYYALEDIIKLCDAGDTNEAYCHGVFAKLCKQQKFSKGQYGPRHLFRFYYRKLFSKYIISASVALFLIACFIALYVLSEIKLLDNNIAVNNQQADFIEASYQKQLAPIQDRLDKAIGVKSSVEFSHRLEKSRKVSPQSALYIVSDIMKRLHIKDMQITTVKWAKKQAGHIANKAGVKPVDFKYTMPTDYHYIKLQGYIGTDASSAEELAEKIRKIKTLFKSDRRIVDVSYVRLPLDTRPQTEIDRVSGMDLSSTNKAMTKNQFEIEILLGTGKDK